MSEFISNQMTQGDEIILSFDANDLINDQANDFTRMVANTGFTPAVHQRLQDDRFCEINSPSRKKSSPIISFGQLRGKNPSHHLLEYEIEFPTIVACK